MEDYQTIEIDGKTMMPIDALVDQDGRTWLVKYAEAE